MIRTFEPRDMDQLLEIWLSASIKAHDFIDASFWQANIESMRDVYIPASETFVIEDSSGVLGFYSTSSVGFYTSQGFKQVKEQIDEQTGHAEFLMCYPG